MLWFSGDIHHLRSMGLHAESHFIGIDAGGDFRVAHQVEPMLIQLIDCGEGILLQLLMDARGIVEKHDGFLASAQLHALVEGGKKATAPIGIASARAF